LSVNNDNKSKIVAKGALPRLFALVRSSNEQIQEHAAVALRNLSVNPDNESKIVAEGGLPPLLGMRILNTSIYLLYWYRSRRTDAEGAVVVAMLRSSEEMIQLQAAVAIRNLSFSPENEVPIVRTECRMLTLL